MGTQNRGEYWQHKPEWIRNFGIEIVIVQTSPVLVILEECDYRNLGMARMCLVLLDVNPATPLSLARSSQNVQRQLSRAGAPHLHEPSRTHQLLARYKW